MTTTVEAINSYITDMLALEEHINKAVKAQIADFQDEYPRVAEELTEISAMIEEHIETLKALSDAREAGGGKVAEAVKRAGSMVAGLGAAAIDLIRNEKLPKNLRDDYTACSLASIGYVMLYTTAVALSDAPVAQVAYEHLADYARATMQIHDLVPATVVKLLQEDGLMPKTDVVAEVTADIQAVWEEEDEEIVEPIEGNPPRL